MAPEKILDYVVVHELCHLAYLDHSKQFWQMVTAILPDCRERREWLKTNGMYLGAGAAVRDRRWMKKALHVEGIGAGWKRELHVEGTGAG